MTKPQFDFNEALEQLQSGKGLTGKDGVLTPLIKQLTEAALKAELDLHLADDASANRKNGYTKKTVKSGVGEFELDTPRDREGTFEPQLIKKHQTKLTPEIDQKILGLFALGTSYRDIRFHIEELYGIDVSEATITAVTDQLIPELKEWQSRSLDAIYPFIGLDAIHYKIKDHGRYVSKAIYTILGVNTEGRKELLGLYLSESEGANYWLSVLTDLHNRGVKDILIASVDGLTGFVEAINSIYPQTEVQQCVIHQIRNSMKYVASKNQKEFMQDLKPVYRAATKQAAEAALDELEAKWGAHYPIVISSWRRKWDNLSVYFKYPEYIRRVIYTTNAIEAVHRQFRKLTKTKGGFPNENSLLKLLYAGILNASKKWTMPVQNWNLALSQLAIHFEGRLDKALDI
ncbi:transposase [Thiomicrospira aerophila AL3]|uniref:Mutator family transposase n=1 Tax=Thiomicrospira aerophila AL3 TaxID=717772 RepID=W0DY61_9GAMM|nr:IS256 family transposase [Thiomicrospira aerophila]AHF01929.1 transposase [Thiomicrospira aerophila AL3]